MTFVENEKPASLNTAYWLFPLYLLLLNLPIIPILWAGQHLSLTTTPDFYVLGMMLTLGREWLAIFVYVGGLSAASAMMIVTTLALSYMCLNHILLPASISATTPDTNLYKRLLWSKRIIIAAIIAAGYGFYIVIELNEGLASLGLISFVAAVQLLPGVLGLLFWTRATQTGFLLGLLGGASVWFVLLILPLLTDAASISSVERLTGSLGFTGVDVWSISTFCSLTINCLLYTIGSLLTVPSQEERDAAEACVSDAIRPLSGLVNARSATEYTEQLEQLLGREAAEQEVQRALSELGLGSHEVQATELRLLHEKLERNLSGLLGPTVARLALRGNLNLTQPTEVALTETLRFMETRLETSREQMRGMTKELDDLRRYLRSVLQELPLGVCSLGPDGEILIWNSAMQSISGISERVARRSVLRDLPAPWSELLHGFTSSSESYSSRQHALVNGENMTFNLHKSDVSTLLGGTAPISGQVLLVEDRTDIDLLESELAHSERLASIGRLAAGVAHEIGNPLTGIASIAQNLDYETDPEIVHENSADILTQVDRINAIVKSLLTFSHNEQSIGHDRELLNLQDSIEEAIRLIQLAEQAKQVSFELNIDGPPMVSANAQHMIQVFVNLLSNACDASDSGDTVKINSHHHADDGGGQVVVTIRDTGPGIPAEFHSRVFEPFYTTKPVGQGTGLGLPLVYSLLNEYGGRVSIDSDVYPGCCVEIRLPAIADDSEIFPSNPGNPSAGISTAVASNNGIISKSGGIS